MIRTRRWPAAGQGRASGFTLVELLVVITIISLLAALLVPSVQIGKELARRVACGSNLRQLAVGHKNYAAENGGIHCRGRDYLTTEEPDKGSLTQIAGWPNISTIPERSILVLRHHVSGSEEVFKCPSDLGERLEEGSGNIQPIQPPTFSYTRNGELQDLTGRLHPRETNIRRAEDTTMLFEEWELAPFNDSFILANEWDLITQRHLGRGCMAFFGGHVEAIDAQTFNQQTTLWRIDRYLEP